MNDKRPDRYTKALRLLAAVFAVLAVCSAGYFAVIVAYAGVETSFSFIWVIFSLIFILMAYYSVRGIRKRGRLPGPLPTFIFTTFVLFAFVFIMIMSVVVRDSRGVNTDAEPDYIIVPGARVYSDGISVTLKLRLDTAVKYYEEHPDTVIVVSGGQEKQDALPEAMAMYNYLSMYGVPSGNLIIDAEGLSTAEIIKRALLKAREDSAGKKRASSHAEPAMPGNIRGPSALDPSAGPARPGDSPGPAERDVPAGVSPPGAASVPAGVSHPGAVSVPAGVSPPGAASVPAAREPSGGAAPPGSPSDPSGDQEISASADPEEDEDSAEITVGVITSDYHLMRCLKVLVKQGISRPTGIPAPSDRILFVHQCVRESMAIAKDTLMGNFTFNKGDLPFEIPFIKGGPDRGDAR